MNGGVMWRFVEMKETHEECGMYSGTVERGR